MTMWIVLLSVIPLIQSKETIKDEKGVIVALIKGDGNLTWNSTNSELYSRNRSYIKYLWKKERCHYDIIIFHTEPISDVNKLFIKEESGNLDVYFVNVSPVFYRHKTVENSMCPSSNFTRSFKIGYKHMCHFWFIDFLDYLHGYDWMLRIDDDCQLTHNARRHFPPPSDIVLASTHWQSMENDPTDGISHTHEGHLITGLKAFSTSFAAANGVPSNWTNSWTGWKAPYSNVMFLRLNWLRQNSIVTGFMNAVAKSGCIHSNRWGDLPLWGIALMLAGKSPAFLKMPYYHGSHRTSVLLNNKLIHYPA